MAFVALTALSVTSCTGSATKQTPPKTDSLSVDSTQHVDTLNKDTIRVDK